jgi:hypothetical protein
MGDPVYIIIVVNRFILRGKSYTSPLIDLVANFTRAYKNINESSLCSPSEQSF